MKPSNVQDALSLLIGARRPVFLWGAPGVGKSQVVAQVAKNMGMPLIDVRAILMDPVDLRGLPHVNGKNRAHWCPPEFLPRDGTGILFLDELNAAAPMVQAACYQLVLDRKIGEYELPDGWVVMAAGNRQSDRAVVHRMPSALANRFVHIEFDPDVDDWVKWGLTSGIMTEVLAFIRFRPALLHAFDPKKDEKAFPSPRSWAFVSEIVSKKPSPEIEFDLLTGTVGEGAAVEFLAFLKIFRGLPSLEKIRMHPATAEVPTDPATLYALVGAISRKAKPDNAEWICEYLPRMPPEFSVMAMKDCMARNEEIANTRPFISWATAHQKVLS